MMEYPTAHTLQILADLAMQSAAIRACLREFLDTDPVIASLEIDHEATAQAGHVVYRDQSSQELINFVSAIAKT